MHNSSRMMVRFWGVRGSIPTPVMDNLGHGGNTTCIEIRSPEDFLIIDGGSGIRELGAVVQKQFAGRNGSVALLMTHFHWDHIQGLPFFAPLYSPMNEITFYAQLRAEETQQILEGHMARPYFPVEFKFLAAKKRFVGGEWRPFRQSGLSIQPFPLNHPQGASGYRMERDGAVVVHASDHEHGDPHLDKILRDHAQNADVLIMDAQYTPEEYESSKRGWGHGTWLQAAQVAKDCNVKQLILFHHDPVHNDAFLNEMVKKARQTFENTIAAKEGSTAEL